MAHNHKVIKVNLAKATGAFKCQYISRLAWESPLLETIAHNNMDGRDKQTDSNHLSTVPRTQQAHA